MTPQPILETPRLILASYQDADVDDVFNYANDEEVARYVAWPAHTTLDDSRAFLTWIKTTTSHEAGKLFYVFSIRQKATGRVIGSIDFKNAVHPYCGQIDYAMGRAHWGKGLMTEAAEAVKAWALRDFPELLRLQSFCHPKNVGSRRVMEKIGMKYEGLHAKAILMKGQPMDIVRYALIPEPGPSPGLAAGRTAAATAQAPHQTEAKV